jgi:hypothetical protein
MFRKCVDPHAVLSEAFKLFKINGVVPAIVKARIINLQSDFKAIRLILVLFNMTFLVIDIWRSSFQHRYIVVREFWNIPLLCYSLILFPLRRRVFFNVNHNLIGLPYHFPHSINLLSQVGFRFILFDGKSVSVCFPKAAFNAFEFPLFPCMPHSAQSINLKSFQVQKSMIAIVGDLRPEKGDINEINKVLVSLSLVDNWSIRLGHRHPESVKLVLPANVKLVDTSSRNNYLQLLMDSDVVVIFAHVDSYFCRHSGTVMDSISCGSIPLIPNLPVLVSQVNNPTKVGELYCSYGEIVSAISQALTLVENFREHRFMYFNVRNCIDIKLRMNQNRYD